MKCADNAAMARSASAKVSRFGRCPVMRGLLSGSSSAKASGCRAKIRRNNPSSVGDALATGPQWVIHEISAILAEAYRRFPDDEMAIDEYQTDDDRTLPFQLSRGCTDKCTFCSEWVFWQRFRPGDFNSAAAGVEHLRSFYGATYIAFTDSLLNGNRNRLQGFAEELLRQGTKVKWGGFMRADMDDALAPLLHRAGCREAFVDSLPRRATSSPPYRAPHE